MSYVRRVNCPNGNGRRISDFGDTTCGSSEGLFPSSSKAVPWPRFQLLRSVENVSYTKRQKFLWVTTDENQIANGPKSRPGRTALPVGMKIKV